MKSAGFHEICMKSGGFQVKSTPNLIKSDVSAKTLLIGLSKNERPILDHHTKAHNFEIWQISWNPDFTWNLADFMKSSRFHADFMKSLVIAPTLHSSNWRVFAETLAFIILGGFHRWNLGELCWISQVKSLVIAPHPAFIKLKSFCWNTCFYNFGWISQVKSGWNPLDFMVEIHQISGWNPPPCIHQTEEFLLKHLLL